MPYLYRHDYSSAQFLRQPHCEAKGIFIFSIFLGGGSSGMPATILMSGKGKLYRSLTGNPLPEVVRVTQAGVAISTRDISVGAVIGDHPPYQNVHQWIVR